MPACRAHHHEEEHHEDHDDDGVGDQADPPGIGGGGLNVVFGGEVLVGLDILAAVGLEDRKRLQTVGLFFGHKAAVGVLGKALVGVFLDDLHGDNVVFVNGEGNDAILLEVGHHVTEQKLFGGRAAEDGCRNGDKHADEQQVKDDCFEVLFH